MALSGRHAPKRERPASTDSPALAARHPVIRQTEHQPDEEQGPERHGIH